MGNESLSRRQMLSVTAVTGAGLTLTACGTTTAAAAPAGVTPPQTEGPFYPLVQQSDKDTDLTQFGDQRDPALGEIVSIEGRVLDEAGVPIADAVVDVWQANAAGRYAHEADPNTAPLDPNFQGWAIMKTNAEGQYKFKTVRPGPYPVEDDWTRPPHIHFKVSRRGYHEITTQMYFEGEPLNDVDHLLNGAPEDLRSTLIATRSDDANPFQFDLVLAKV